MLKLLNQKNQTSRDLRICQIYRKVSNINWAQDQNLLIELRKYLTELKINYITCKKFVKRYLLNNEDRLIQIPTIFIKGETNEKTKKLLKIIHYNNFKIIFFDKQSIYIEKDSLLVCINLESNLSLFNLRKINLDKSFLEFLSLKKKAIEFIRSYIFPYKHEPSFFVRIRKKLFFIFWLFLNKIRLKKIAHNFRYYKLNKKSFLNLNFIDSNELNYLVRNKQFSFFTNSYQLKKIKDIVSWYGNKSFLNKSILNSSQPKNIILSNYPRFLDLEFWENGNSYFLNSLTNEFRKDVLNYEKIKSMLSEKENIYFSSEYYKSLREMTTEEVSLMLKDNPISIKNNSVSSGRHRVSSMIGRIINGKEYIPFYIDRIS